MSPILFLYAKGGPPLEYALPKIAAHGDVHVLALAPLPESTGPAWRPWCTSITSAQPQEGAELVSLICAHAARIEAAAVLTLSEYAVVAVARACLRLGLAGAGEGVLAARDKRLMRQIWHDAGVPVPGFAEIRSPEDIALAFRSLEPPLLLKAAWSAGSTAHLTVRDAQEAERGWRTGRSVMEASSVAGYAELHSADEGVSDFLLEEIVRGDATDWFDGAGWGDYVSVEGIVADGVYHPLCITGRMPTIPPFTERASITPAALPEVLQRRIEEVSRAAVDALALDTCATHTEIKLGADGAMWLIETAARFGGVMTTCQAEAVFGLDMIGMLVRQLLGESVAYPSRMLTKGSGAAGSLVILAADTAGEPWKHLPRWDFQAVDWSSLLGGGSRIELVRELSLPAGTAMPAYEEAGGANSMAAVCLVSADSGPALLADCERIVASLPHELTAGRAISGSTS